MNSYKVSGSVEAAKEYGVTYAQGYDTKSQEPDEGLIAEAVKTAKEASVAVVFIGITDAMESEGFDRADMNIPACQQKLLEEVIKVQPNTVVVVECGSAIEMPWIDGVRGVLYAYLGGEAVGPAVVDLLYGDKNPCGKLAETLMRM